MGLFPMKARFFVLIFVIFAIRAGSGTLGQTSGPQVTAPVSPDAQRALVNRYCAGCHNDKVKSGGFDWNTVDLAHPEQSAEHLERVIRKLRAGLMPPPGRPRPDAASVKTFVASLESRLDQAAAAKPYIGRPALHRLNRTEYAASVQDLLDLTIDVNSLLPPDVMSHGFD